MDTNIKNDPLYVERTLKLSHTFTDQELSSIGEKLADFNLKIDSLKEQKKREAKALQDQIDDLQSEAIVLSRHFKEKTEARFIKCSVAYDVPEPGKKTVVRTDTGERMIMDIDPDEVQTELFTDYKEVKELTSGETNLRLLPNPKDEQEAEFEDIEQTDDETQNELNQQFGLDQILIWYGYPAGVVNIEDIEFYCRVDESTELGDSEIEDAILKEHIGRLLIKPFADEKLNKLFSFIASTDGNAHYYRYDHYFIF